MAQSFVKCEICDKRECALICVDCDQYFCQECKEGHIKTKTTKDHKFLDSGTFQPQYKKLRCTQHEQHFIFFCERCQTLVCPICLPENHQEHRMLKIDEVASSKKKVLNETIKTFVTKLNEFQTEVNNVQNITEKCQGENNNIIQHVNKQANDISKLLENQRRCIIRGIKQKAYTETERIAVILEDLQHCLKEAKEMERKVKLYLNGSDTSLLSNFQVIKSKVDTFHFQDTAISTCPVQFAKYSVQKEELSLLESVIVGNLCGLSRYEESTMFTSQIHSKDKTITELRDSNCNLEQQIKKLQEHTLRLQKEKAQLSSKYRIVCKEKDDLTEGTNSVQMVMDENEQNIKKLLAERENMKKLLSEKETQVKLAKEDTNKRLSSVAGEKLTKGNAAITDLGDPNRPMKIGEKYGELYDNEWTDAMENITTAKAFYSNLKDSEIEEIIICHLHRLLKCCYAECLSKADDQIKTLLKAFTEATCLTMASKEEIDSLHICKEAIALRKLKSEEFAKFLFENKVLCKTAMDNWNYSYKNEEVMKLLMTSTFFEKCVHLCWCMVIQDPVMYLDEDLTPDTPFDKNTYKEFVRSGDKIAYVVWPALFLHKDGPLLYKGVVQAYRE